MSKRKFQVRLTLTVEIEAANWQQAQGLTHQQVRAALMPPLLSVPAPTPSPPRKVAAPRQPQPTPNPCLRSFVLWPS